MKPIQIFDSFYFSFLFSLFYFFFFWSFSLESWVLESSALESRTLFLTVQKNYQKLLPRNFIASVSGERIQKSMAKIPESAYCKGKTPQLTYVFFRGGRGESLVVENVVNPYVNRFQHHLELYRSVRELIERNTEFEEFQKTVFWRYRRDLSQAFQVVEMRKKRTRPSDYFLIYLDKQDFLIRTILQYNLKELAFRLNVNYRKIDRAKNTNKTNRNKKPQKTSSKPWIVPNSLELESYNEEGTDPFELKLSDYRINRNIQPSILLDLQEDCASLNK